MIGLTVPILLLLGNRSFGISSSLRHICAVCVPAKIPFFQYNWKEEAWNLMFVTGILIGGFIAAMFLSNPETIVIAESTQRDLNALGITNFENLLPAEIFSWDNLFTLKGLFFFVIGGFLVGFGTRYAGGCTSGHAIMGISNLQWPSVVATIFFMIGGLVMTHLFLPFIMNLVGF
ncbi:putative transmembrane protein [Cyclobacterium qasimii M12-11B]|uniref:Putative transmembrane protein n=2 Tax=Cyclobacterium qasimii TaxID=1350429 RepID=S7VC99_9BACT|nr:putative transmembrane protein [Cyclobacterium qasimii M12-11B]